MFKRIIHTHQITQTTVWLGRWIWGTAHTTIQRVNMRKTKHFSNSNLYTSMWPGYAKQTKQMQTYSLINEKNARIKSKNAIIEWNFNGKSLSQLLIECIEQTKKRIFFKYKIDSYCLWYVSIGWFVCRAISITNNISLFQITVWFGRWTGDCFHSWIDHFICVDSI